MALGYTTSAGETVRSLTATTIRRSIVVGRLYLGIASVWSLFLALIFVFGVPGAFAIGYPFVLPLFATLGSIGGLMTFSSDRSKGVFEYLISYGIRPRSLFNNGLLSTAALVGINLAIALGVGVSLAIARGVALTGDLGKNLAIYSLPMSFASALFTVTVGMIWASLSTPRTGMNSPVGVAPLFGIVPTFVVVLVAVSVPSSDAYYAILAAPAVIIVAVVGLLAMSARLMRRERFLSPL